MDQRYYRLYTRPCKHVTLLRYQQLLLLTTLAQLLDLECFNQKVALTQFLEHMI